MQSALGAEYLSRPEVKARKKSYDAVYYSSPEGRAVQRNTYLLYKFGITLVQWDDMFKRQGRCCVICKATKPGGRGTWHTDHCHTTGKVRGILCTRCNTGVGFSRESIPILKSMIEYLERHAGFNNEIDFVKMTKRQVNEGRKEFLRLVAPDFNQTTGG